MLRFDAYIANPADESIQWTWNKSTCHCARIHSEIRILRIHRNVPGTGIKRKANVYRLLYTLTGIKEIPYRISLNINNKIGELFSNKKICVTARVSMYYKERTINKWNMTRKYETNQYRNTRYANVSVWIFRIMSSLDVFTFIFFAYRRRLFAIIVSQLKIRSIVSE